MQGHYKTHMENVKIKENPSIRFGSGVFIFNFHFKEKEMSSNLFLICI
jgi:hypothetical protein